MATKEEIRSLLLAEMIESNTMTENMVNNTERINSMAKNMAKNFENMLKQIERINSMAKNMAKNSENMLNQMEEIEDKLSFIIACHSNQYPDE